jgi:hypothetical protein
MHVTFFRDNKVLSDMPSTSVIFYVSMSVMDLKYKLATVSPCEESGFTQTLAKRVDIVQQLVQKY